MTEIIDAEAIARWNAERTRKFKQYSKTHGWRYVDPVTQEDLGKLLDAECQRVKY